MSLYEALEKVTFVVNHAENVTQNKTGFQKLTTSKLYSLKFYKRDLLREIFSKSVE